MLRTDRKTKKAASYKEIIEVKCIQLEVLVENHIKKEKKKYILVLKHVEDLINKTEKTKLAKLLDLQGQENSSHL
ncbi:hypothetical protein OIU77_011020 [Salix suchowensis]|uniref:Ribosomal protein S15 n=1 Tax=Salix suchowensis TaxID=1278906 RepID=A0ABQ9ABJ2_9ROSI|nr:hypothetical protein OIU77_011020 [Salix suchowensis]